MCAPLLSLDVMTAPKKDDDDDDVMAMIDLSVHWSVLCVGPVGRVGLVSTPAVAR